MRWALYVGWKVRADAALVGKRCFVERGRRVGALVVSAGIRRRAIAPVMKGYCFLHCVECSDAGDTAGLLRCGDRRVGQGVRASSK